MKGCGILPPLVRVFLLSSFCPASVVDHSEISETLWKPYAKFMGDF